MGKGEESNGTESNDSSTFLTKNSSEASKMLEAALLQMDGIISGKFITVRIIIIIISNFYIQC